MLTFRDFSSSSRLQNRRDFLRLGALGVGGLNLPKLLRLEAAAPLQNHRPKSIIYIVLNGGSSHIDMYDLKPNAPAEFRGPFRPIATRLPGVHISEAMPMQAARMDRLALLRGIRSVENDHFLSEVYSGLPRPAGRRPSFGSVVSRLGNHTSPMPPYVSLDRSETFQFEFEFSGYAGPAHSPFRPFGNAIDDLAPVRSIDRLQDRRQLLTTFDAMRRQLDQPSAGDRLDPFQARAMEIITSSRVRDAFDLSKEPAEVRAHYGRGRFPHQTAKHIMYDWGADKFLLARRLVEAGVRVVTLKAGDWDHHTSAAGDIFFALECLLPLVDRSLCALLDDLEARGLSDDVLVVMLGEFGRTPLIGQPGPGREHWAEAGCAIFAGGGLRVGQVIGETDSRAERSRTGNLNFQNIFATIYQTLGIPLDVQLNDFNGRPQYLLDEREPIRELTG